MYMLIGIYEETLEEEKQMKEWNDAGVVAMQRGVKKTASSFHPNWFTFVIVSGSKVISKLLRS